jgi:hypothetical protein
LFAERIVGSDDWLAAFRRYTAVTLLLDLVWEFGQMPLYTVWAESWPAIVFAGVHCLGGDLLIASACLWTSLTTLGDRRWPAVRFGRVAVATVLLGFGYTVFSEWLNVHVRQSWAYRDLMPLVPPLGTGLSPLLQWILVPAAALVAAGRKDRPV